MSSEEIRKIGLEFFKDKFGVIYKKQKELITKIEALEKKLNGEIESKLSERIHTLNRMDSDSAEVEQNLQKQIMKLESQIEALEKGIEHNDTRQLSYEKELNVLKKFQQGYIKRIIDLEEKFIKLEERVIDDERYIIENKENMITREAHAGFNASFTEQIAELKNECNNIRNHTQNANEELGDEIDGLKEGLDKCFNGFQDDDNILLNTQLNIKEVLRDHINAHKHIADQGSEIKIMDKWLEHLNTALEKLDPPKQTEKKEDLGLDFSEAIWKTNPKLREKLPEPKYLCLKLENRLRMGFLTEELFRLITNRNKIWKWKDLTETILLADETSKGDSEKPKLYHKYDVVKHKPKTEPEKYQLKFKDIIIDVIDIMGYNKDDGEVKEIRTYLEGIDKEYILIKRRIRGED